MLEDYIVFASLNFVTWSRRPHSTNWRTVNFCHADKIIMFLTLFRIDNSNMKFRINNTAMCKQQFVAAFPNWLNNIRQPLFVSMLLSLSIFYMSRIEKLQNSEYWQYTRLGGYQWRDILWKIQIKKLKVKLWITPGIIFWQSYRICSSMKQRKNITEFSSYKNGKMMPLQFIVFSRFIDEFLPFHLTLMKFLNKVVIVTLTIIRSTPLTYCNKLFK